MAKVPKRVVYSEPSDYFPKEIRQKAGIGSTTKKTAAKKSTVKKSK